MDDKPLEARFFNFYGVKVLVRSTDSELLSELDRDFRFFSRKRTEPSADIELHCLLGDLPKDLPELSTQWISPRCLVYEDRKNGLKWISYYGHAGLLRWNTREEKGTLWCSKGDLLHEIAYLAILSRVGELWDRRGLHRLHAAGLCWDHQAILLVLPSGGGKTTFALSALQHSGLRLLSDDMPVIDEKGNILAFANRIGCTEEPQLQIPRSFVRIFLRQEHGVKWLIDTEAFSGRIAPRALPGWLLIGSRKLSGAPRLMKISKWAAWKELFRSGVVGVGLPQVIELFLNSSWSDTWSKIRIALSRAVAMARLIRRSQTFGFELGPDKQANLTCFLRFLEEQTRSGAATELLAPTEAPA